MEIKFKNLKLLAQIGRVQIASLKKKGLRLEESDSGDDHWVITFGDSLNLTFSYDNGDDARADWGTLLRLGEFWETEQRNAKLKEIEKYADLSMRHIQGLRQAVRDYESLQGDAYYAYHAEFGAGVVEEFLCSLDQVFQTAKLNTGK